MASALKTIQYLVAETVDVVFAWIIALLLLSLNHVFLASILLVIELYTVWRAIKEFFLFRSVTSQNVRPDLWAFLAALVTAGISIITYIVLVIGGRMLVTALGIPQPAGLPVTLMPGTSPTPPTLVLIYGFLLAAYAVYLLPRLLLVMVVGGGMHRQRLTGVPYKLLVGGSIGLFVLLIFPQFFLGGQWGNAGKLVGGAGYGISEALGGAADEVVDEGEKVWNQLQPSRNRQTAEIVCSLELFAGGAIYESAAGGVALSQCVEQKMNKNETVTPSERVTQPVVVKIQKRTFEPFRDHVRMEVPVTNTLVTDLQGRPIDIPAKDVKLTVEWRYLGSTMATASKSVDQIPNGDTHEFVFDETGNTFYFPVFTVINATSNKDIRTRLNAIVQYCSQTFDADSCQEAQEQITIPFANEHLSVDRVAFLVKTTDGLTVSKLEAPPEANIEKDVADYLSPYFTGQTAPNILAPGETYDIVTRITYDYTAEAAFTQASRWRSTNNLLEVWTESAWEELSFKERQQWENRKCGGVTRFDREITKQRTAALTTPIIPVMYVDCGGSLFRDIDNEDPETGTVSGTFNITVGATVNTDMDATVDKEQGFTIRDVSTDCNDTPGKQWLGILRDSQPAYKEGVGWIVNPGKVERTVMVQGQRRSIACKLNMAFTVNLIDGDTYTTLSLQEVG